MARRKSTVEYVAISDLSIPPTEQEGYLLVVEGRGGYTEKNQSKALELALTKFQSGDIPSDSFPDGITLEHIKPAAPLTLNLVESELLPIQIGAREVAELARLHVEVQDTIKLALPYRETLKKLTDCVSESQSWLTDEEKEQIRNKNFANALTQAANAIAAQDNYRQTCSDNYKLILGVLENYSKKKTRSSDHQNGSVTAIESNEELSESDIAFEAPVTLATSKS